MSFQVIREEEDVVAPGLRDPEIPSDPARRIIAVDEELEPRGRLAD